MSEESKELQVFSNVQPLVVLAEEYLDNFMAEIKAEVAGVVFDVDTEDGRQDIKAMGKRIRASMNCIEKPAKEHAGKLKEVSGLFDKQRKIYRDFMGDLEESTLNPLVEYVAAETAKTEAIESLIESLKIADAKNVLIPEAASLDTLYPWLAKAAETLATADFGDQKDRADSVFNQSFLAADGLIARFEKVEREETAAEIKRIAEAQEAQEKRDAELIKDAKEKTAKAEQDAKDAKIKAEQDAEAATKLAGVMAKEAAERVEQAAKDGALKAIKVERDRLINEGIAAKAKLDKENAAIDKKKSTQKHRHTIHVACKASLMAVLGFDDETASKVVKALSENKIEHAEIRY